MNYLHYIGIDVSKETLDLVLLDHSGIVKHEETIENKPAALKQFLKKCNASSSALFCLEPTGHYSNIAVATLLESGSAVWVATPADIRNSIGMQRGKNDRIDAKRIAQYAHRFNDKARLVQPSEIRMQHLKQLLSQRERLVADKAKYLTQLGDFKNRIAKEAYAIIYKTNQQIIKQFDRAIAQIEQQLEHVILSLPELKTQYELLQTITGVGKVLAQTMVVFTNGFDRFNTPRAFACHAGVAPFEYTSGTSVRSKRRVSHRSNKRLKTLLHLASLSAIRLPGELRTYYERKVAEGKSKMSVLNAVRNKIIKRIFAVIKRNSPFIMNLELS